MVRKWVKQFLTSGLAGLEEAPRPGAPPRYGGALKGQIIATALTNPQELGQPFASWTFERLATYLQEVAGIPIHHSRLHELLTAEGLRWHQQETWFTAKVDPDFAAKRGQ
jgi:transposase